MSRRIDQIAAVAAVTGALVAWWTAQAGTESIRVSEEVCKLTDNFISRDPEDPNGWKLNLGWFIHPVIVDCSQTIAWNATASATIQYDRSVSLARPTTGTARTSTVGKTQQQVKTFAQSINLPPQIGPNVKPYYTSKASPTIKIVSGSVVGNASAEWRKEWWDLSLIEPNPKGNTEIAERRAGDIRTQVIEALRTTGATVTGESTIKLGAKINPLTRPELGPLYDVALNKYGNGENRVMQLIAEYNAWIVPPLPELESAVGSKRYAEATITYTASGIDRKVDTSNWNYAYWIGLASILGVGIFARKKPKK